MNGVKQEVLKAILDYMYLGEVRINQEDLPDFLRVAEEFKIRGVTPVSRKVIALLQVSKFNLRSGLQHLKTANAVHR